MRPGIITTAAALACLAATAYSADPPTSRPADIPLLVRDESAGDWVVDRFAGNSTAGTILFQGPAVQMGGAGRSTSFAVAPDGRAWFPVQDGIVEVSADGIARLVVSRQEWKADGLDDLYGRGGLLAWNPADKCLYFWGKSCIRKLVEKPDGSREIVRVVGDPSQPGVQDGPGDVARLNSVGNIMINSRGAVFFYDGPTRYGTHLRKFEGGAVSTITDRMRAGGLTDGPLATATFNFINLGGLNSVGENDDVLYIGDHWNSAVRRIDLKAGTVTRVFGLQPEKGSPLDKRRNNSADGPALTHASSNSGNVFAVYDAVHNAVWLGGPDEVRLRRLRLRDGWVKTVMGSKPGKWDLDGMGNPADNVKMSWCWVLAVDVQGRAYVMNGASKTGYWRLHQREGPGR